MQTRNRRADQRVINVARLERGDKHPRERLKLATFAGATGIAAATMGVLSLIGAYFTRLGSPICGDGLTICNSARPYLPLMAAAAVIRMALALRRRPWQQRRLNGFFEEITAALSDAALGSLVLVFFTFFFRAGTEFQAFSYSRSLFIVDWLIASVLLVAVAIIGKRVLASLRGRGHNLKNVVLIGKGRTASAFEDLIESHPELGYRLIGSIEANLDGESEVDIQDYLLAISADQRLDEAILATNNLDSSHLRRIVGVAELVHVEIKAIPELFGLPPTKVTNEMLGHLPVLSLLKEPLPGGRRAVKRAIDIFLGSIALLIAGPVLLVSAIAVRRTSQGPIIYKQERIGMDGRPFQMLKFRTMFTDNDPGHHREYVKSLIEGSQDERRAVLKLTDDPRITPTGQILRRLSIDELPQLFNVLRGEMSLVGPRPALPFEVELYTDVHRRRLEVRPGMTGLWQVNGRSKVSFSEMVTLDIHYIERWSAFQDLLILSRTIPAVLRRETG